MNNQGNTYTFLYSVVLVVVVAALLSIVSLSLQPRQNENRQNEKRQNILSAIHISSTAANSAELFDKYIKEQFIINSKGDRIEGKAFDVNIEKQYNLPVEKRELPVFVANVDGATKYILPIYGAGLWGPIWGYISLDDNKDTVYGTFFDHQGETPGLGAEITTPEFNKEFRNKQIFSGNQLVGILVVKGGNASGANEVDAISGGTITSKGVETMIKNYLTYYEPFLNKNKMSALFSAKNREFLLGPLSKNNPVIVQVLGICSALAVTAKLEPAIVMGLSVTAVTAFSNVILSLMRNTIPTRIRIIVQLVVVAALVIIVDQLLKAFAYDVSKQLSVYVGLIITNCIIMGRIEAFALANKPWPSLLDGIGNGLGYGLILVIVAFFRELLGSGTLYGFRIIPESWYVQNGGCYLNNGLMIMPAMALILVGLIIWVHRSRNKDLIEK